MTNALGLCQHNNMGTSCPTCIRTGAEASFAGRFSRASRGLSAAKSFGANFAQDSIAEGLMSQGNSYSSSMNGRSRRRGLRGMGEEACQPGFYRLKVFGIDTGQCLPSLDTALSAAQGGVLSSVGTGIATSPTNVAAAQSYATQSSATKLVEYVKAHPYMVAGAVGVVGLLAFYGGGKALFGRR